MATGAADVVYEFAEFQLNPAERLLLRQGRNVLLTPKAFDLLVYLVEHHGRLVEKNALISALWPDTIVEEANLAFQISALRKVLDEGRAGESLIQTVPTKGYRFVGDVTHASSAHSSLDWEGAGDQEGTTPTMGSSSPVVMRQRRTLIMVASGLVVLGVAGLWLWTTRGIQEQTAAPEPTVTRLTANPTELSVTSARISPDGKYVAYSDRTGIQVRVIDTGDVERLPDTQGMTVYAWTADGTKVRAARCDRQTCTGWDVSMLGGARQASGATWPATEHVRATWDGSRLLTTAESGDVKMDLLDGAAPRIVAQGADFWRGAAEWSADASRVYFVRNPGAIHSVSVDGGPPRPVFSADKGVEVREVGPALSDGRILAVLVNNPPSAALVEIEPIGPETARARPLTDVMSSSDVIEHVSVSSDGSRVTFLRTTSQQDIYLADFDETRSVLTTTPRRLTLDDRDDFLAAWTLDGKGLIFSSQRRGAYDLFRQALDSDVAAPFVVAPGKQLVPRVTSDGRWVLYTDEQPGTPTRVMRTPIEVGRPEPLVTYTPGGRGYCHCSFRGRCVVLELDETPGTPYRVFDLDPIHGRGRKLTEFPSTSSGANLTPDGEHLAYIVPGESGVTNRIRTVSFGTEPSRDVIVRDAHRLENLDSVPSGGFLSQEVGSSPHTLLFITPEGRSTVLWAPEHMDVSGVFASPDGRRLAIVASARQSNVWLLDRR